jgi:hypothetical protein
MVLVNLKFSHKTTISKLSAALHKVIHKLVSSF